MPLAEEGRALQAGLDRRIEQRAGQVGEKGAGPAPQRQPLGQEGLHYARGQQHIRVGAAEVAGPGQQRLEDQQHQRHMAAVGEEVARGAR